MRATTPIVNIDTARVSRHGNVVTFTDPDSPWTVQLRVHPDTRDVNQLRIDVRSNRAPITLARLGRLPLAGMVHLAATTTAHPNETYYRMKARPKSSGQIHWGPEHWEQVLEVFTWAESTGRPGGGRRAIADLWGVAIDPTVRRWLLAARSAAARSAADPDA